MSNGMLRSAHLVLSLVLAACAGPSPDAIAQGRPANVERAAFPTGWGIPDNGVARATAREGMVVTTDRVASEIGADILRRGGNAVDATVATHFALAVVNPAAGNIGGGGFLVIRLASGSVAALDFRETAPGAAKADMFLDASGNPTDRSLIGHLASGVPGSVAGMWEAHRRFGSLPWPDLLAPAIALAEGIVLHERLALSLQQYAGRFRDHPATAAVFLPGGRTPRVGERFAQADLAETLRRIARDGKDGFYTGRTAELIEAEMRRGGGLIDRADLARYEAKWRDPISFAYRDHRIISMPPPSSGGATLAEILNILEGYDLRSSGYLSPRHIHLLAEAFKRAFADRNAVLADPDFVVQPIERMTSDAYAAERRAGIRLDRATPASQVLPGLATPPRAALAEGDNTTHYSIVDRAGNAVAGTTTLNSLYGSRVVVAGAGFFLNNTMDDFTVKPGVPNQFGLVQGEANAIEPGKRMLSAMTPTIVVAPDGRLRLVTGSPGGPTIITTVTTMISAMVDWGMDVPTAAASPRVHHQHLPDQIDFERAGLPEATAAALRALGHSVSERGGYQGESQSIAVLPDGTLVGVADPRSGGAAVGVGEVRQVVQ